MADMLSILVPTQQLRQTQEQGLSLQAQQRMRLLGLALPELRMELRQRAELNPFLEYEAPLPEVSLDAVVDAAVAREGQEDNLDYFNASLEGFGDQMDAVDRLELERRHDWTVLNQTEPETLYRHLAKQIYEQYPEGKQRELLLFLCDALDDDGYLRVPMRTLMADWWQACGGRPPKGCVTEAVLAEGIRKVQALDPFGVGARSLAECLELQVRADMTYREERALYLRLCHRLGSVLTEPRERLAKQLRCTPMALSEALAYLRTLNPFPGRVFAPREGMESPEVVAIQDEDGAWHAICDERLFPLFRVDEAAVALAKREAKCREERRAVEALEDDARLYVEAYHERNATLLRIAERIFNYQSAFLASGGDLLTLRPLLQYEIAKEVGYDESTISRTLKNKSVRVATNRKLIPMKAFFTRSVTTEDATERQVKEKLRQLIDTEDRTHPLSDQMLTEALAVAGMPLARRTVAKYREALGIPSTRDRRQRYV